MTHRYSAHAIDCRVYQAGKTPDAVVHMDEIIINLQVGVAGFWRFGLPGERAARFRPAPAKQARILSKWIMRLSSLSKTSLPPGFLSTNSGAFGLAASFWFFQSSFNRQSAGKRPLIGSFVLIRRHVLPSQLLACHRAGPAVNRCGQIDFISRQALHRYLFRLRRADPNST